MSNHSREIENKKMNFEKYVHLERFGAKGVKNIERGKCFIFPKLDGTNASVWLHDGQIQAGSRNFVLSREKRDNFGFLKWASVQENLLNFLKENPTLRLFGEWLVRHQIPYRKDAWKRFFVFDVADEQSTFLHYQVYQPLLEKHNIEYIKPIAVIDDVSYQRLTSLLKKNDFLMEKGEVGEGIVVKNYDFKNRHGRSVWAKLISSECKEKTCEKSLISAPMCLEEKIAQKYVTAAFCEKELAKMKNAAGKWTSEMIPKLLNDIYAEIIIEESWNFVSENNNPSINFSMLKHFVFLKIKERLPFVFSKSIEKE